MKSSVEKMIVNGCKTFCRAGVWLCGNMPNMYEEALGSLAPEPQIIYNNGETLFILKNGSKEKDVE